METRKHIYVTTRAGEHLLVLLLWLKTTWMESHVSVTERENTATKKSLSKNSSLFVTWPDSADSSA